MGAPIRLKRLCGIDAKRARGKGAWCREKWAKEKPELELVKQVTVC